MLNKSTPSQKLKDSPPAAPDFYHSLYGGKISDRLAETLTNMEVFNSTDFDNFVFREDEFLNWPIENKYDIFLTMDFLKHILKNHSSAKINILAGVMEKLSDAVDLMDMEAGSPII